MQRAQRSRPRILLAVASLGIGFLAPTALAATHGDRLPIELRRISVASDGGQANGSSESPIMSEDGRFVVFSSFASNLVPQDDVEGEDVFVHDRVTGSTRLVSINSDGEQANGRSFSPTISPDGRYIVFYSFANNLAPGISGSQVYRHDLHTGITEPASLNAEGVKPDGASITIGSSGAVSRDGRYVVYASTATDIVPGTPRTAGNHIYLRDMVEGTNKLISIDVDGAPATLTSQTATISPDGRVVAFETRSPLDPRDTNGLMDVYVRDHMAGTTEWISTNNRGEPGNDSSWRGRMNEDGSLVTFDSSASNFVPLDQGALTPDVFVRDRVAGRTVKIGSDTGEAPNDVAFRGWLSSDGRFLAYWSGATNIVSAEERPLPGLAERAGNVYLYDRLLGATETLSAPDGGPGNDTSQLPGLSGSGEAVAFQSFATNLVPGDTNGVQDAFARQIGPPLGFLQAPSVALENETLSIAATVRATGDLLASARDPFGDLEPVQDLEAVAGDIISATLAYRGDAAEELLFKVLVDHLPTETVAFGYPGVTYGVAFTVEGVAHEIRMSYNGSPRVAPPTFELFRCDPVCTPAGQAKGSFGRLGDELSFAVSIDAVGGSSGAQVTDVRAFVTTGSAVGSVLPLDDIELPAATIPEIAIATAVGDVDAAAADLDWTEVGQAEGGSFTEQVSVEGLRDGSYLAWARVCLVPGACSYRSVPFQIGGGTIDLIPTQLSLDVTRMRGKVVATAMLATTDGVALANKNIVLSSPHEMVTVKTNGAGMASFTWPPNEVKPSDTITARFAGDETHAPSEASGKFGPRPI